MGLGPMFFLNLLGGAGKRYSERKAEEREKQRRLDEMQKEQQYALDRIRESHNLDTIAKQAEKMEEEAKYDAVKQGFVGEINSFINENKSDFEYVAHNDATDVVYDVIEEHYNETGRILDIKEAVQAVESYLEEEAEKLLNLGKVKNRLTSMKDEYEQPQRQSQTTLSNAHSAQGSERVARKLTDEESKSAMAKMLQWDE